MNSCFFHLFFTHSTDCSYLRPRVPPLCRYLPLTNMHTYTLEHTLPGAMWECLFIRQRPAAHLVTAQDGGVGSGQGARGRGGAGKGRARRTGPQVFPSGSAQPAHSSSFSAGASTGMSPHVRDHCLKGGLLVWLKRPFRKINRDESQMCCAQFPKVMSYRIRTGTY